MMNGECHRQHRFNATMPAARHPFQAAGSGRDRARLWRDSFWTLLVQRWPRPQVSAAVNIPGLSARIPRS
jgi:hypothetical protein